MSANPKWLAALLLSSGEGPRATTLSTGNFDGTVLQSNKYLVMFVCQDFVYLVCREWITCATTVVVVIDYVFSL